MLESEIALEILDSCLRLHRVLGSDCSGRTYRRALLELKSAIQISQGLKKEDERSFEDWLTE